MTCYLTLRVKQAQFNYAILQALGVEMQNTVGDRESLPRTNTARALRRSFRNVSNWRSLASLSL